jgi:hypothetical protein
VAVFGRVSRAVTTATGDGSVIAAGILHTYNPQTGASALAIGLGTAGIASPGTATTPDGKTISPVAEAVSRVINWGESSSADSPGFPAKCSQ